MTNTRHFKTSVSASEIQYGLGHSKGCTVSLLCDRMGGGEGEQSQYTAPHIPGTLPSWQRYPGR